MLAGTGIEVLPQSQFEVPPVEETGLTFVENALIKARNATRRTGLPAIADDSGLVVDALDGAPGIYSSRYGGPGASDADNLARLLDALHDVPPASRTARFHCAMVLLRSPTDPVPLICEASWEGRVAMAPRGSGGFGYDPVFAPNGGDLTTAELEPAEKNRRSHRGQALRKLAKCLE